MIKIPRVSVIVPVYNVEKYLPDCLDSLINQSLKEIEIVCVNDGSPDKSLDILVKYAKKDSRIKIISQINKGLSGARNSGINKATGEYLLFVDSDDYLQNNALETLYTNAKKNDLDMLLYDIKPNLYDAEFQSEYEKYVNYYKRSQEYSNSRRGAEMLSEMIKNHDFLSSAVLYLIKKTIISKYKLKFFEGIIHEDNLFTVQALLFSKKVSHIKKELYIRNVRSGSIMTNKTSIKNVEGYFITIRELLRFPEIMSIEKNVMEELMKYIVYGLQRNLLKYISQLPKSEIDSYLLSLNNDDLLLFNLLTELPIIEKQKELPIKVQTENMLQFKNTKYNRYSMKIGKLILYIPKTLLKLIKKSRRITLRIINKTKIILSIFTNLQFYSILIYERFNLWNKETNPKVFPTQRYNQKIRNGNKAKVSIIMPVFNSQKYLKETIPNIQSQSFKDFELICVNDGSKDESFEIIKQFAMQDSRIKIIDKKKENAGQARNLGLEYSTGEYVIFLDSDDKFDSQLIEKMYMEISEYSCDICVCNADKFDDITSETFNSNLLLINRLPDKKVFNKKDLQSNLFLFCTPCPWNKIFRRKFLIENNIRFQSIPRANDLFFVFYSIIKAKKITVVNEQLVHYRIGATTSLQSRNDSSPFCFAKALFKLKSRLVIDNLFDDFVKQSFVNMAISNTLYNFNSIKNKKNKNMLLFWLKKRGLHQLNLINNPKEFYLYDNYEKINKILNSKIN